jgi:6-phosphogluconolactonase
MGADGHTASLFPGTSALGESARWVVATRVEQFGAWRITLTFPALRAGRRIVFLVTGRDKAAALARVLGAAPGGHDLPAARIAHSVNGVIWLIDQAAAAELG